MTESEVKYTITIETQNNEERLRIGNKIHEQLKGNPDYVNNNIILNIDQDCTVRLWIYTNCTNIPSILKLYLGE